MRISMPCAVMESILAYWAWSKVVTEDSVRRSCSYMIANLRLILEVEVQSGKQVASKHSAPGLWDLLKRLPSGQSGSTHGSGHQSPAHALRDRQADPSCRSKLLDHQQHACRSRKG